MANHENQGSSLAAIGGGNIAFSLNYFRRLHCIDLAAKPMAPEDIVTTGFACQEYRCRLFELLVKDFQEENPAIRSEFVSAEESSGQAKKEWGHRNIQ